MEPAEDPEVAPATLRLRELWLRCIPVEVEWTRDHGRARGQAGDPAVELPELPARAGEDDVRTPGLSSLRAGERCVPFAGQVEDERALRQRLAPVDELAERRVRDVYDVRGPGEALSRPDPLQLDALELGLDVVVLKPDRTRTDPADPKRHASVAIGG